MLPARLIRLSLSLALIGIPVVRAQQSNPPPPQSGALALPAKKPAETRHPPPKAAPVAPVRQAGSHKATPVLKPKPTPAKHPAHAKAAVAPAPVPAAPPEAKPAAPAGPVKGGSGLPLPRFAALRSDEVNMRSGPGTRYPIEWVYKRRDLPMEIEREFEVWRLVQDPDGVKGWVHQATLTGRRSFIVTGGEHTLRRAADETSGAVAVLKPGVIGRIRACQAGAAWCEVQVGDYRGWLKRDAFWGAYPTEAVNP